MRCSRQNVPMTENPARTASSCRFCGSALHHTFVDLGMSPLCESLSAGGPVEPDGGVLSAARVRVRALLSRAAGGIRQPGGDLHRVRLFLVLLGQLAGPCQGLHRGDGQALPAWARTAWSWRLASNDGYLLQYFVAQAFRCWASSRPRTSPRRPAEKGIPTLVELLRPARLARELVRRRHPGRPDRRQQRAGPGAGPQRFRGRHEDPARSPRA